MRGPEAASMAGVLYLYRDTVHIIAGRHQAQHPRYIVKGTVSRGCIPTVWQQRAGCGRGCDGGPRRWALPRCPARRCAA